MPAIRKRLGRQTRLERFPPLAPPAQTLLSWRSIDFLILNTEYGLTCLGYITQTCDLHAAELLQSAL